MCRGRSCIAGTFGLWQGPNVGLEFQGETMSRVLGALGRADWDHREGQRLRPESVVGYRMLFQWVSAPNLHQMLTRCPVCGSIRAGL